MKNLTIKIIILFVSQVIISQNRYSETTPSHYKPINNSSNEMDYYLRQAEQKATAIFYAVEQLNLKANNIIESTYDRQLSSDMYDVLSALSVLRSSNKISVAQAESYYNHASKLYNKAIKSYNKRIKKVKKEDAKRVKEAEKECQKRIKKANNK